MRMKKRAIIKFAITLFVMTVIASVLWEQIGTRLYDCTDDCGIGFLIPGGWVHEFDGRKLVTVSRIVHGRPMSEPDTILQGWSIPKLWGLWSLLAATCLGISSIVAWSPWNRLLLAQQKDANKKMHDIFA